MNEQDIIDTAIQRLTEHTGLAVQWRPRNGEIDGEADFHFDDGNLQLFIEVKKEPRLHQLGDLITLKHRYQPLMIVAENIFPTVKEQLRKQKINYLDAAGNIFLDVGGHYIWIETQKPVEQKKVTGNRAFTKTGLKMVFQLLLDEEAINSPHRQLAAAAGIALGNVKNVIEGLKDAGFVLRVDETRLKLQHQEALLNRWLTGFQDILKPALHTGNYRFWDKKRLENWQDLPLEPNEGKWGGEPGGDLLTHHLVPVDLTVYTNEDAALVRKWTLIPDPNGNIHFYKKFWNDEQQDQTTYAPPLLVYADLMVTGDPRCRETAAIIYNNYLKDGLQ